MANEFVARNGINIGTSTNTAITSDGSSIFIKASGNTYLNTANSAYVSSIGVVYGTNFSGPGTGLTGTATSLSIGGKSDGAIKLWSVSHPNDFYISNTWDGTYWQLTSNHGSAVNVGHATSAGTITGVYSGTITSAQVTTALGFTPVNYTHPAYTTRSITATGASVLSTFTSDAIGSVTGISTRTLTLADLGYTGATNANNFTYTHPAYTTRSITATGASVLSTFTSDAIGSVTAITTRTLTLADLGYTGATNANNFTYTHPAYTTRSITATGASVLSTFTSDAIGSVTAITTRTLTLADLGYTGATNANYITAVSQLSNDSSFVTSAGNVAGATNVTGTAGTLGYSTSSASISYTGAGGPQVMGSTTNAAMISFHRSGAYAINFGLDTDNVLKVGGWSAGAVAYAILHANNYNSYSPTLTGTGASGTWSINVTGNAATIDSNPNRTDGTAYPVVWSNTGATSPNYSCAAVTIQSSTGTLQATTLRATSDVIAYYSDSRLKNNLGNITNALDKISKINGIYYTANELAGTFGYTEEQKQVGVIAQEIQAIMPEIIKSAPFDTNDDGTSKSGENYITVQYEKIIPLLIEGIKEQQNQIENQQKQIDSLLNK